MKKEEILLHAIGMLPDEMAVQDVTEELMAGAVYIEKEEKRRSFLHKCGYALAAAACFAVIATSINILGEYGTRQPDAISDSKISIMTSERDNSNAGITKSSEKNSNIRLFVYGNTGSTEQQKSSAEDKSCNDNSKKEVLYGKTVKLETVKEMQDSIASKKAAEPEYIVFGMDRDFYFTVSKNTGKTYILNGKSRKKRLVSGKEVLCKAGNKVYFDISGIKPDKGGTGNIDTWDKDNIEVIAFADIYVKDDQDMETAGSFYIGRKTQNKAEKGKEGDVYYGFFKSKNGN